MTWWYSDDKREIGTVDSKLAVESVVVGILVVLIGLIVHAIVNKVKPDQTPAECQNWNQNHIMEICLFLTGAATHMVCDLSGINQWYVNRYSK